MVKPYPGPTAQDILEAAKLRDPLIDHPPNYTMGEIEVFTAIMDWRLNYPRGQVVKYVARARHKGTELLDLKKARWYLDQEISRLEAGEDG